MTTKSAPKMMSISEIDEYLTANRVSSQRFWEEAMGGDKATLPRVDVVRIAKAAQS